MKYAADTSISPDRSRTEIEKMLVRYGADRFAYGWHTEGAFIGFRYHRRMIRFDLPEPNPEEAYRTPTGRARTEAATKKVLEQMTRQRWRALALVIKAKLEAVESGITTFEKEFLAHTLLPSGETVGEWAEDQLDDAITSGRMPSGLLLAEGTR